VPLLLLTFHSLLLLTFHSLLLLTFHSLLRLLTFHSLLRLLTFHSLLLHAGFNARDVCRHAVLRGRGVDAKTVARQQLQESFHPWPHHAPVHQDACHMVTTLSHRSVSQSVSQPASQPASQSVRWSFVVRLPSHHVRLQQYAHHNGDQ
jgi:hypothetical protein